MNQDYLLRNRHRRPTKPNTKPIMEPERQRNIKIPIKGNEMSGLSRSIFSTISGKYNPEMETIIIIDRHKRPVIK